MRSDVWLTRYHHNTFQYHRRHHSVQRRVAPLFLFLSAMQVAATATESFHAQAVASGDAPPAAARGSGIICGGGGGVGGGGNDDACSVASGWSNASGSPNYAAESARNANYLNDHTRIVRSERWLQDLGVRYQ
jgi:hypothetical protein